MKPSYFKGILQAQNCTDGDITEIEKISNSDIRLDTLVNFIKYAKSPEKYGFIYKNIFEMLNVGENSISRFMEWLLNVEKPSNSNSIIEKIRYDFCSEFLKKINLTNNNLKYCKISELNNDLKEYNGNKIYFDIVLEAMYENDDKTYIYVIENKKNAVINCNKRVKKLFDNNEAEYVTQLEMYNHAINNYIKENGKDSYIPFFVFMCAHECYLENKLILNDIPKSAKHKLTIMDKNNNKYDKSEATEKNVDWLLNEAFNYKLIEHSTFIIDLFKVLKNNLNDSYFTEFGTIKPTSMTNDNIKELLKKLLNASNFNQKNISIFLNKIDFKKDAIMYNMDILPKLKNEVSGSIGSIEINFKNFLNDLDNIKDSNLILEILFRYIEYWELHHDVGLGRDYIEGYTKIVNGIFIEEVCTDIFTNKELMLKINKYSEIRKVVIEIAMFKLIEPLVDIFSWEIIKTDELKKRKDWFSHIEKDNIDYDSHIFKIKGKRHYIYYDIDSDRLIWVNCNNKENTNVMYENYSKFCEMHQKNRQELKDIICNKFNLNC